MRIYAHRGASRELPENTLPAFRRALALGADALETDVHETRDGHLVVSHDPDCGRVLGAAGVVIARSTLEEVRAAGAPSLEELVRAFPGVPLNVDLKSGAAALAVATLRRLGAEEQVTLASFRSATLRQVRALGYRGPTSLGRSEVALLLALPAAAQPHPRGAVAQLPTSLARRWVVERCHALGLRVDFWTVNDPAEARRIEALGADGIMTDDPAVVVPALRPPR